ncbi:MAG: hypothetical protein A2Z18_09360 [Armatimonadetes bacterium RBG_16_58_9]|nr:MAG: hypothetical protein A2Z18_09360 [Armatimonadetes bacterium RBG_16_58_9]
MKKPDQVLPYFIVHELPVGLSGLLVAAIFAATMSSASAGMNSLSTAVIMDFYRRGRRADLPAAHYLKASRLLTLAFGVLVVVLALLVGNLGTIIEITYKLNLPLLGVLLAVFLLGILTSRVNHQGALVGVILGTAITSGVIFGTSVSFALYSLVAFVPTFAIGYLASFLWRKPESRQLEGLTYGSRMSAAASRPIGDDSVAVSTDTCG